VVAAAAAAAAAAVAASAAGTAAARHACCRCCCRCCRWPAAAEAEAGAAPPQRAQTPQPDGTVVDAPACALPPRRARIAVGPGWGAAVQRVAESARRRSNGSDRLGLP
jgi:hypothetical protein